MQKDLKFGTGVVMTHSQPMFPVIGGISWRMLGYELLLLLNNLLKISILAKVNQEKFPFVAYWYSILFLALKGSSY